MNAKKIPTQNYYTVAMWPNRTKINGEMDHPLSEDLILLK